MKDKGCEIIYQEAFTGMTTDRPKFSELLQKLEKGDTLVVTKLDRFSRTAADGAKLVQELFNKGVIIDIINMGRVDNTPKQDVVKTCVNAVEQLYKDLHGEEKYNKVVESVSEMLLEKGITITELELKMLVEAAVGEFNKVFETDKAITDSNETE